MQCLQCKSDVSPHYVVCPTCQAFLGFPNVREAETARERTELQQRYVAAQTNARQRGCESQLNQFAAALQRSSAVISRRWGTLTKISEHGNELFKTFYQQVAAGERDPKDSYFDQVRLPVDTALFRYYYTEVHFAALTLDARGPMSYGECSLVLREATISHRTTVFEENALVFFQKHQIVVGQPLIPGFRAVWNERHKLGVAKYYSEITDQTPPDKFPGILLKQKGATNTDEFIEVHIYGRLDLKSIERFIAPKPKTKDDQVLASRLRRKLKEAGTTIENP